jgi:2-phospho-L-lactate guanylyltransferase
MNIWIIIPTKPFDEGKTRLASVLSNSERFRLNREYFERTFRMATDVCPVSRMVVASRSKEARAIAHRSGAQSIAEGEKDGLNETLARAAGVAQSAGADGVLSLSCDLPFLAAADLLALLEAATARSVVVASDRTQTGTNALVLAPVGIIPYSYGEASFDAHLRAAQIAGVTTAIVSRPGLAFDIDTPEDLVEWRSALRPSQFGA